MKILLIGTCRIHEPLCSTSKDAIQILNTERIGDSAQYYTHSTLEIKQRLLYFQKEYEIEDVLKIFQIGPYPEPKLLGDRLMNEADVILIEVPSRKVYEYNGHFIQESRLIGRLKKLNPNLLINWRKWADQKFKGLGTKDKFDTSSYFDSNRILDHEIISNIVPYMHSIDETLNDIDEIYNMTKKKAIFVTHINGVDKKGKILESRDKLVNKISLYCENNKIPCINPTEIVNKIGQKIALSKDGKDLNHYQPSALIEIGDWFLEQIKLHK